MFDWNRKDGKPRFSPLAIAGMVVGGAALAVGFAFLFGWVVMLLWNWLMPEIFGLPRIGYWQGWGLVLLSHILIKPGLPGGHDGGGSKGKNKDGWKTEAKARFERDCRSGEGEGAGGGEGAGRGDPSPGS
ncbi:MAG: hypothetical protein KKA67_07570 [Spirochaetes bacterium]|nr:hypothetical protein [Spirochaetota bacterium]